MTPTEAIEQMAVVAVTIDGIREAQYPAKGQTPKYPSLVLLWGPTSIEYQSTEQYWAMSVRGLLLTGLTNELKHHVAEVDPLIARVADKFSAGNLDGFLLMTTTGDHCDGCELTEAEPSSLINYGGQEHYGANLTFSIQLRRFNS